MSQKVLLQETPKKTLTPILHSAALTVLCTFSLALPVRAEVPAACRPAIDAINPTSTLCAVKC